MGTRKYEGQSCCAVVEESAARTRERRASRKKPQPFVARKLMVGITLGIIVYTFYVYIDKFCVPMLRRAPNATGSPGAAIALLVVFSILWLWMMWAYVKAITTGPGKAKDHIKPSAQPIPSTVTNVTSKQDNATYSNSNANGHPPSSHNPERRDSIGGPSYEEMRTSDLNSSEHHTHQRSTSQQNLTGEASTSGHQDTQAGLLNAIPNPVANAGLQFSSLSKTSANHNSSANASIPADASIRVETALSQNQTTQPPSLWNGIPEEDQRRKANVFRMPPMTPVLLPEHRYCPTDAIVKPYRAHHCRTCGTCILKYDHHCPWIGQCVGARNHKFFMNFNQATVVFTVYTFSTLLGFNISAQNSSDSLSVDWDPQVIVIVALSALFALFTFTLLCSHIRLILMGQSTVESMQHSHMKERESSLLTSAYGYLDVRSKRQKRAEWDNEWGRIGVEGNIWWQGSPRKEWEEVMGRSKVGWFLPVGSSLSDGLSYTVNPRFDEVGRWRRRVEWPKNLR